MGTMMEFPVFYGEDPEAWASSIEAFVIANGLSDFETRQLAYGCIGGKAHAWYCDEASRSGFYSWRELKSRLIQRFSMRAEHVRKRLERQQRQQQLDRLGDWLEQYYREKATMEKQQEGSKAVHESDLNQIPSQDGGYLKSIDPVPVAEQNKSMATAEVKDHLSTLSKIPSFVSDPTVEVVGCEEGEARTSQTNLFEKVPSMERKGSTRRKKKRWKEVSGIKNRNAYHVFDKMPLKGNKATEKSKQWKMKLPKLSNQNVSAKRRYQGLNCRRLYIIHVLNKRVHLGFMKEKKKMRLEEHDVSNGTLYLRGKRVKMKSERGRSTKSKGWKHKAKVDKSEMQSLQRESVPKLGRKRETERRKRVKCVLVNTHQKFNRLLSFIKKKKGRKKLVCDKKSMKLFHTRDFAKLARDVPVLKRNAKEKRMKFKHNHKKQKEWIKKLFSGNYKAVKGNSKLVVHTSRRKFNRWSKENCFEVAYSWRNEWLQLNVLEKLSRQWLLAADKFGVYKRCGYENICLKGDRWIQWYVLTANGKLVAIKRRKRAKSKFKIGICGSLVSFLITIWTKLRFKWRERMYKHKTNNRGRVIDKFGSTKMRVMSKDSWGSRMVKSFCSSVAWCFSGNGIMGFASGGRRSPHSNEVARKMWLLKFTQREKKKKKYHGSPTFSLERVKETTMWSVKILMKKHGLELQYRVWETGVVTGGRVGSGEGNRAKWKYKGKITAVHVDDEEDAITEYSIFLAETNPMQLKYDQMLEWGPEGYVPTVVTSTQWKKTGIRVDMNREQPVEFSWQDYIYVAAFTWDIVGDARKRNQQGEPNENLFALDVIYVLFGAPRPPEQSLTRRGSRNKGWDVHDIDEERQAEEIRDREKKLSRELGVISSRKRGCLCNSVLCWKNKDKHEEPSLLKERNNASISRSMCLNLEDKVDFNGGGIVMCGLLMKRVKSF